MGQCPSTRGAGGSPRGAGGEPETDARTQALEGLKPVARRMIDRMSLEHLSQWIVSGHRILESRAVDLSGDTELRRFKAWVGAHGLHVEDAIVNVILESEALLRQLQFVRDAGAAVRLHQKAAAVPRTETRATVRLSIHDQMVVGGIHSALFFRAFKKHKPRVLKVPFAPSKAQEECRLWRELSEHVTSNVFLVPVTLLKLSGEHKVYSTEGYPDQLRSGILMPEYTCDLESVPVPLVVEYAKLVIDRMSPTLHFIHQHRWLFADVKPSNMFLDAAGNPWLGDYGSSCPYDEIMGFTGGTPQFQCKDVSAEHEPLRFDLVGLAISILVKLDLLHVRLAPRAGWPLQALLAAIGRVDDDELKGLLSELVQTQRQSRGEERKAELVLTTA